MCAKIFIWLATQDRCWTVARRARHGLSDNPTRVFCDQTLETIDHLLAGCPFSRAVWHSTLAACRLKVDIPTPTSRFIEWWSSAVASSPPSLRKGVASLGILVAWSIWKHRNAVIFDAAAPSYDRLTQSILDEAHTWALAGARGLAAFSIFEPP
ncbi:hypothetical protein VPH35_128336 [Triticum aestivum]